VGEDGSQANVGGVLVSDPQRLVVSWDLNSEWKPDARMISQGEVKFIVGAPDPMRFELEHRSFENMGAEAGAFMRAPRAFKVMATARLLDIDHTLRVVDLRKGEQMSPEYAALNPNMRMPTLEDGDYVLWESNAILQYLASKRPDSGVWPEDARARLDVTRWQFWDLAHWDSACAVFAFEYVAKRLLRGDSEPDMAAIAKGTEAFHRVAKVLDGQLQEQRFVTGKTLTLADFSLGSALNLAGVARYPLHPYGAIKRWHGELMALPAWQQTLAACALPTAA